MAPRARKVGSLSPTGSHKPTWGGPAEQTMAPYARKIGSLPPTGGSTPPWGGPAETW